jgi:hypothetical protein
MIDTFFHYYMLWLVWGTIFGVALCIPLKLCQWINGK